MIDNIFNFSADALARPLLLAAGTAALLLIALALWRPHIARIGLRNARGRRLRAALIVFGLMLSTTFVAAALAIDDTLSLAVKSIAVYDLGKVDEDAHARGGSGQLSLFPERFGERVRGSLAGDPDVAGVAPALRVDNLIVADQTSRQLRGGVTAYGMDSSTAGPLGDLRSGGGAAPLTALAPDEVYLNDNSARLLNARPGDTLYLYSTLWPGQRHSARVRAIVSGGPLGDAPAFTLPLPTLQDIAGASGEINHVYIANSGGGLSGVARSHAIAQRVRGSTFYLLRVDTVKADGVQLALRAQGIFGRILTLFTLFALAIGLLLIFLIFSLLAAERRTELGMARAIGLRREHVTFVLLFEGATYDLIASAIGMLAGLGIGVALIRIVSPILQQIGFPLTVTIQPQSMVVAFCLGLLFTLATILVAAWTVSRMTVAAALRDLPEPPAPQPTLVALATGALRATLDAPVAPQRLLPAWGALLGGVSARGLLPALVGWLILRQGVEAGDAVRFSLGLSLLAASAALLVRWLALAAIQRAVSAASLTTRRLALERSTRVADRLAALVIGLALALYWSLPFDALASLGFPRFAGGILVFFVAGVMMVFGVVWALAPNLDLALAPLRALLTHLGRLRHVTRIALVYPAHHRFRTGVGLSLFSLVCFTMVVMSCIAASATDNYDNTPAQASGYDVAGQALFTPVGSLSSMQAALQRGPQGTADGVQTVSVSTPLLLGMLQPGAAQARWSIYPAFAAHGGFLDGVGLPLVARAQGYADDAAVWRAVRAQPGAVVIDAGALSQQDAAALGVKKPDEPQTQNYIGAPIASGLPGLSNLETLNSGQSDPSLHQGALPELAAVLSDPSIPVDFTLRLRHIVTGAGQIAPTPLWVADLRGGPATKLTVVGVVDNAQGQRYGLFGSPATFAATEQGLPAIGNQYYYFKLKPGVDAQAESYRIGSALLDYGFETTVLQDLLLNVNGPRVFISRVLVGLVGLTLLVGMAALAVTGSRAVVERRQQIGMLRALGFHRLHVQLVFLLESLLVGVAGTAIGLALGLILCRNVFAVNFFDPVESGLTLIVPWTQLAVICAIAVGASLLAALLPAWQAGRVTPADALRYE